MGIDSDTSTMENVMPGAIALLTREPLPEILAAGGTGNWVTSAERVRGYPFVVLVRNGRHPSSPSDAPHRTAFLVGRISGTRVGSTTAASGYPRNFIEISEYALITLPDAWSGSQNPVWFTDLANLGINEHELQFQPVPCAASAAPETPILHNNDNALAEMRRAIAARFNVPASAVDITIRL
jgi:hypothetical protein